MLTEKMVDVYKNMTEATESEINEIANRKYRALGKLILEKVVKPYCDANQMSFSYCNGDWWFSDHDGNRFDIGEDHRPKPGRPDGPEGDEDCWFLPPTEEEKLIYQLLHTPIDRDDLGCWVPDYDPNRPLQKG